MGAQEMDLLGIPMAMGSSPRVVVMVVIKTGRMRTAQDSMMAWRKGFPWRMRTFNSIDLKSRCALVDATSGLAENPKAKFRSDPVPSDKPGYKGRR